MQRDFQAITTYEEVDALVKELENGPDLISLDVETGYVSQENVDKRSLNTRHPDFIVVGFSITNDPSWSRYIPLRHDNEQPLEPKIVWEKFRRIFETKTIIAHNASFERAALNSLYRAGDVEKPLQMKFTGHDTMIMARVLGKYKEVGLKALTKEVLGESQTEFASLFGSAVMDKAGTKIVASKVKKVRFNQLPITPEVINYACDDTALCLELFNVFKPQLTATLERVYNVEMNILVLMSQAEEYGVGVDWAGIQEAHTQYKSFRPRFEQKVREEFAAMSVDPEVKELAKTANFGSSLQMRKLLYDGLGMHTTRTTPKGEMSTDAKALEALSRKHPAVRSLLSLREIDNMGRRLDKWLKEYSDCYDGRVHASFSQTRVISGRFAASDPALMQLPKQWLWTIRDGVETNREGEFVSAPDDFENGEDYWYGNFRKFIISEPGKTLCTFDYSQQELRVLAGITQEPAFVEAFKQGDDPHKATASLMFSTPIKDITKEQRQKGKTCNFALLYGMGAKALGEQLAMSKDEAEDLIAQYKAQLSKVGDWDAQSRRQGIASKHVTTWFGRYIPLWDADKEDSYVRSGAERLAVNAQIQGGAADYTKLAMIRAWSFLKREGLWGNDKVMLTMNQHDSLTFEVADDLDMNHVRDILQKAVVFDARKMYPKMQIPVFPTFDVDWELGKTWGGSIEWPLEKKAVKTETGWAIDDKEDIVNLKEWEVPEPESIVPEVKAFKPLPDVLHVVRKGSGGTLTKSMVESFRQLVESTEGPSEVVLTMGGRSVKMKHKTNLTIDDAPKISMVLGGAEVFGRTKEEMEELL